MNNFIKRGKGKCADEYFVGKHLEEGILTQYKYTYYDLKDKFKEIGKDINNGTFSHWIEDLDLRRKGLAVKKGKDRVAWYLNEEGLNLMFEYGKDRKIGYIRQILRITNNNTYKCEVEAELVQQLGIKRVNELNNLLNNKLKELCIENQRKIKQLRFQELERELEQKQLELEEIKKEMMTY